MMKRIFFIIAISLSMKAWSQQGAVDLSLVPTLESFVRTAPVYFMGRVRFEESVGLFHDQVAGFKYLIGQIQPHQDLEIYLSKNELQIKTEKGLRVWLAGLPVNVTFLKYSNQTGQVDVHSALAGIDFGDYYIEKKMASEIKNRFQVKLRRAFERLLQVRQQKNVNDAATVINEMISVFKDPPRPGRKKGKPLPTFTGELSVIAKVDQDKTLRLGKFLADLQSGGHLVSTLMVRVPAQSKMQIRGLGLTAPEGILLRPIKSSKEGVATLQLRHFSVEEGVGFSIDASNGLDRRLNGLNVLLALAEAGASGRVPDEHKLDQVASMNLVQQILDAKLDGLLSLYVKAHREELIKAGATPELITTLERKNSTLR